MGAGTQRSLDVINEELEYWRACQREMQAEEEFCQKEVFKREEELAKVKRRASSKITGTDEYRAKWEQAGQLRLETKDAE